MRIKINLSLQYKVGVEEPPVGVPAKLTLSNDQFLKNVLSQAMEPDVYNDGLTNTGYWRGYNGENFYPLKTTVDLEGVYFVQKIRFYDGTAGAVFKIRSGVSWNTQTEVYTTTLNGSGWREATINAQSAIIELEITTDNGTGPSEAEIICYPVNVPAKPERVLPPAKTFSEYLGFNANTYIPTELFPVGSLVRQYEYLEKTRPYIEETQEVRLRFNPTGQGTTMFDVEYQQWKDAGLLAMPLTFHSPQEYKSSYLVPLTIATAILFGRPSALGTKTFTVGGTPNQYAYLLQVGKNLRVSRTARYDDYVRGPILSYSGNTLTMNITETDGEHDYLEATVNPAIVFASATGNKTITVGGSANQYAALFPVGGYVKITNGWEYANYCDCTVVSYSGNTLIVTINVSAGWRTLTAIRLNVYKASAQATVFNGGNWNTDYRPCSKTEDPTLPYSYREIGKYQFQRAARYGRTPVDFSRITVNTTYAEYGVYNEKKTALDRYNYQEYTNESDRWWTGKDNRDMTLDPIQYVAAHSAIHDGHEGSIPDCGIKAADPTMIHVAGALADMNIDYIRIGHLWAKDNRADQDFPADVINFHFYTTDGLGQYTPDTEGQSPEVNGLVQRIEKFIDYPRRYLPTKQIFWTEFGYDTSTWSALGVPGDNGIPTINGVTLGWTTWQIQGMWTLRTFFEVIPTRYIDRFCYYEMQNEIHIDEVPNDPRYTQQFATSGFAMSEWTYALCNTAAPINVSTFVTGTNVTFTDSGPLTNSRRWKPGQVIFAQDQENNPNNTLSMTVVSYTGKTLVCTVTGKFGSGTLSNWYVIARYSKKLSWFMLDNANTALHDCTFVEHLNTSNYRLQKWSNFAGKDVFVIWTPTELGITHQIENVNINIGTNSAYLQELESTTRETTALTVSSNIVTVTANEMPKIIVCTL